MRFFLLSVMFYMLGSIPVFSQRKTVVDYYNITRVQNDFIYKKNNMWYTTGILSKIPVEIVDIKNGYIKIIDKSYYGIPRIITAALFFDKDKKPTL